MYLILGTYVSDEWESSPSHCYLEINNNSVEYFEECIEKAKKCSEIVGNTSFFKMELDGSPDDWVDLDYDHPLADFLDGLLAENDWVVIDQLPEGLFVESEFSLRGNQMQVYIDSEIYYEGYYKHGTITFESRAFNINELKEAMKNPCKLEDLMKEAQEVTDE